MPRKLSPNGEAFLISELGEDLGRQWIDAINAFTAPEPHNHRCNEPPYGNCGPLLREIFGEEEGIALRDAINTDAERFESSRSDRSARQSLAFPSQSRPITKEKLDQLRISNAERQRRYRERVRAAREAQNA